MCKISGWLGLLALCALLGNIEAWGSSDKVKLKEIDVLTLYHGRMTTGRRSSPVPQLNCVGGTAAKTFTPQVVQCYNRGSDGFDVQWECKSDMDNAYRFGKVEVICEGYDYPDDPYILKGSCGLEYTLDLTKEGFANQGQHQQHNYYGGDSQSGSAYGWKSNVYPGKSDTGGGTLTNIACGIVLVIIVFAIYKTCIAKTEATNQRSRTNDDYPDSRGPGTQPPPPGFRYPSAPPGSDFSGSDSCGAGASRGTGSTGSGGGGFWTGAATGGLMGYLFGARNNQGYNSYNTYSQPRPSTYGFTGGATPSTSWGGGGSSGFSSGGGGGSSSGTRTASGFGGTRRR